jgi:hypothetical protein
MLYHVGETWGTLMTGDGRNVSGCEHAMLRLHGLSYLTQCVFFISSSVFLSESHPAHLALITASLIMTGNISVTSLGLADARINEAEVVSPKQEQTAPVSEEVSPPVSYGTESIYLDTRITFENYAYWANRSREVEKSLSAVDAGYSGLGSLLLGNKAATIPSRSQKVLVMTDNAKKKSDLPATDETTTTNASDGCGITESEWEQAQRAVRTATWGSIFYLIATDLLGPNSVPWAFSKMGYGPGVVLYTLFGALSCYSGLQLWNIFVGLDSTRFPMRNYGDVAFRVYGSWARTLVNIMQSFQFLMNVTLLIETNGQGLAQMVEGASQKGFLCFISAQVIFTVIGMVLGQIRTLQRLSFLATIALWLNIVVIIMTMVVVHQYPPNYSASLSSYKIPKGPIQTSGFWPPDSALHDKVNALMNAVFSYGGATLFNELMAEMRRPYDFWKGFIIAEAFIYCCYIIFGMVVYSAQGQFTFNPAYQGKSTASVSYLITNYSTLTSL